MKLRISARNAHKVETALTEAGFTNVGTKMNAAFSCADVWFDENSGNGNPEDIVKNADNSLYARNPIIK